MQNYCKSVPLGFWMVNYVKEAEAVQDQRMLVLPRTGCLDFDVPFVALSDFHPTVRLLKVLPTFMERRNGLFRYHKNKSKTPDGNTYDDDDVPFVPFK